jgi:hypothetical protein
MGKIVKTSFGAVDGQALEKLQDSFDTAELLRAVDAIDQVRYRDDDLRQDMLNLHGMAHNLINQDYSSGTRCLAPRLKNCVNSFQKAKQRPSWQPSRSPMLPTLNMLYRLP